MRATVALVGAVAALTCSEPCRAQAFGGLIPTPNSISMYASAGRPWSNTVQWADNTYSVGIEGVFEVARPALRPNCESERKSKERIRTLEREIELAEAARGARRARLEESRKRSLEANARLAADPSAKAAQEAAKKAGEVVAADEKALNDLEGTLAEKRGQRERLGRVTRPPENLCTPYSIDLAVGYAQTFVVGQRAQLFSLRRSPEMTHPCSPEMTHPARA